MSVRKFLQWMPWKDFWKVFCHLDLLDCQTASPLTIALERSNSRSRASPAQVSDPSRIRRTDPTPTMNPKEDPVPWHSGKIVTVANYSSNKCSRSQLFRDFQGFSTPPGPTSRIIGIGWKICRPHLSNKHDFRLI